MQVESNSNAVLLSASSLPCAASVSTDSQNQLTVRQQQLQQRSHYVTSASTSSSLSARAVSTTEQQSSIAENVAEHSSDTAALHTTNSRYSYVLLYLFIDGTAWVTVSGEKQLSADAREAVTDKRFRSKTRRKRSDVLKSLVFSIP